MKSTSVATSSSSSGCSNMKSNQSSTSTTNMSMISEYLTKIKSLWDELSRMKRQCTCGKCTCEGVVVVVKQSPDHMNKSSEEDKGKAIIQITDDDDDIVSLVNDEMISYSQRPDNPSTEQVQEEDKEVSSNTDTTTTSIHESFQELLMISNTNNNGENLVEPTGKVLEDAQKDVFVTIPDKAIVMPIQAQSTNTNTTPSTSAELFRCIIYGGKNASINSLAFVGGAAGAGLPTKAVMSLGSTSVLGGACQIFLAIWELRRGHVYQEDTYVQTLGRRDRYMIHLMISVVSHLIFGLVPLVSYTLHTKEVWEKALVTTSISYPLILLLWTGKVHMEKAFRPYLPIIAYIVMSVLVSGSSYLVNVVQPVLRG